MEIGFGGKVSGGIEYDAACTVFRDVDADRSAGHQNARIVLAKGRQGLTGFVGAKFEGARGGRWTASDHALTSFTKEAKTDKARTGQMDEDDRAVLKRVPEKGADPIGALQYNCGLPATRAKRAVYRLLEAGKLEARKETRIDAQQRSKTHDVIGFPTLAQENKAETQPSKAELLIPWMDGSI